MAKRNRTTAWVPRDTLERLRAISGLTSESLQELLDRLSREELGRLVRSGQLEQWVEENRPR